MNDREFDVLLFCAFRYALGRKTYIVSDVVDLIIKYKEKLNAGSIFIIKKEINKAIEQNQAGMSCDVYEWNKVLEALKD